MDSKELNMESHSLGTSNYGFSAMGIDDLGATEYTLVTIAVDVSGSVSCFKTELETCLQQIILACQKSPRADNLLIRIISFNSDITEMHGFKELAACNVLDYKDVLYPGGVTSLFDASVNALEAINTYGGQLYGNDFDVNGIVIIITDGADNNSTNGTAQVKAIIDGINQSEQLESMVSILVGVNVTDPDVKQYLDNFRTEVGFTQYENIDEADQSSLAKLAEFVSKSISSQSQALGTGGASVQLTF